MAKTYEALLKSKGNNGNSKISDVFVSDSPSPDLTSNKQMLDLNYMIDMKSEQDNFRVINFVSSRSREGTSTVIVNFIKFMLERKSSSNVLLIDANLQHPSLHLEFNVPPSPGLKDILWKKAKLSDTIYKIGSSNIYLIPNGNSLIIDSPNVEPQMYSNIISKLSNRFQYIFIDSPPLLESPASLEFANIADITFIVVQAHRTQWEVVEKAKNYLGSYNCRIGGVILNRVLQPIPDWIYKRL
jgi:MinD-like ATPase involved in chromosome partitioning or flagellar assembly